LSKEADLFEELTPLLRVRPELQAIRRFGAQWAAPHEPEPEGWAPFHIVTAGQCRLEICGTAPLTLTAGDVVILPHGGPHTIKAVSEAGRSEGLLRSLPRPFDSIVIKTNVEAGGNTGLICGRFHFEQSNHNTVLAALPPFIVVPAIAGQNAGRISSLIGIMKDELEDDRPGAATVATAVSLAVMVIVLRVHLEVAAPRQGVLAPVAFLAELRLSLARGRIRSSRTSLAVIAEDVGYQSETAFSRAYQRQFGVPPSGDRSAS
jgi:AraC family transcriptional activator of mtrCDE